MRDLDVVYTLHSATHVVLCPAAPSAYVPQLQTLQQLRLYCGLASLL